MVSLEISSTIFFNEEKEAMLAAAGISLEFRKKKQRHITQKNFKLFLSSTVSNSSKLIVAIRFESL